MIILNIDFKKIDKERLKRVGEASYGDLVCVEFKNGPRESNGMVKHGIVKQGVTKEERDAGVDMPIIGDFRIFGGGSSRPQGEHSSRPLPQRPASKPFGHDADPDF